MKKIEIKKANGDKVLLYYNPEDYPKYYSPFAIAEDIGYTVGKAICNNSAFVREHGELYESGEWDKMRVS